MKKVTYTSCCLLFMSMLTISGLFAQNNINIPYNTGPTTFTINPPTVTNFFDDGGAANVYQNGSGVNSVITFAPSAAGQKIRATFSVFSTEASFDALYIFNGSTTASPLFASANGTTLGGFPAGGFWGTGSPGVQTSTAAAGTLTFQFRSDASVQSTGWAAVITQVGPCVPIAPANITASTGTANCTADVTTAVPTFNPAGCGDNLVLQYKVDGGALVTVPVPHTVGQT